MAIPHQLTQKVTTKKKGRLNSFYNSTFAISWDIGVVMIMIGAVGFFNADFLGLKLSFMHSLVLVTFGALAIWSGMTTKRRAFIINLSSGIFFLLNSFLGILVGDRGQLKLGYGTSEDVIVKMAPGFLELSTFDHVFHFVLAVFFFIEAYSWKSKSLDFPQNLQSNETDSKDAH
jgi:hypothetical protein